MLKPARLAPGDRVAIVAPASPFERTSFEAGVSELRRLGLAPTYDADLFVRDGYVAGVPSHRAAALVAAWADPTVAGVIAARGGYGSVQLLPLIDPAELRRRCKAFIGCSDVTSLLLFLTTACGVVAFHGPMVAGQLARGVSAYDEASFRASVMRPEPLGEVPAPGLETLKPGEATGPLLGGTLTQLVASLGTPYAFDPPAGHLLFIDEVNERPYRIDRMITQLRLSGLLGRAAGIVFGELPGCDEPGGRTPVRPVVAGLLRDFPGPVVFGLPSGHTTSPALTLPLGVAARLVATGRPRLVIEEAAVR